MDLTVDYTPEAGKDETLQEDLDYIAKSKIPFELLYGTNILVTGATGL